MSHATQAIEAASPAPSKRRPYTSSGVLRPICDNDGGPHFVLFSCGAEYHTEPSPPHPQFLNAVHPQGSWVHVLQGSLYFQLDGTKHRVGAGQSLLMRQPNAGSFLRPNEDGPLHTYWINVAGQMALQVFDYLQLRYGTIQEMSSGSEPVRLARRLIRLVDQQPRRPIHFWSAATFQWMNAWWQYVDAHYSPAHNILASVPRDSRLVSTRNVKNFAARVGYSRSHLTRKLTQQWNESPGRVLRRVRLEEAARLLHTTRMSVRDVATKVGYSGSDAFSRAFSRQYKQSPLAYRHAHLDLPNN